MITIFNRRQLAVTYALEEKIHICRVLAEQNIAYLVREIHRTAPHASNAWGAVLLYVFPHCLFLRTGPRPPLRPLPHRQHRHRYVILLGPGAAGGGIRYCLGGLLGGVPQLGAEL